MFVISLYFILISFVYSQGKQQSTKYFLNQQTNISIQLDICTTVNCGSGVCLLTQNPALPYFCRCPNGANSILPCPSQSTFLFYKKTFNI